MSLLLIRQMFETAINAIEPGFPTQWENTIYEPIDGTPYQKIDRLLGNPQNPTFSNPGVQNFLREIGIYQVVLFYPLGSGPAGADTKAEAIRTAFPQGKTFTSGTVTLIVQGTPTVAPGRVDGNRWSIPVKIPFFANIFF
jgi:hypothetical protein